MATQEINASVPDITPGSEWSDGSLWEDFSLRDASLNAGGSIDEGGLDFYSYGKHVVEADIVISHDDLGNKVAYIDDLARPEGYVHDEFTDPEAHLISAFKTVFTGLHLDRDIKKVEATPHDLHVFGAILRAGIPEGWRRNLVSDDTEEAIEDWGQAWAMMLECDTFAISYERMPDLRGISSGRIAVHSSEIAA